MGIGREWQGRARSAHTRRRALSIVALLGIVVSLTSTTAGADSSGSTVTVSGIRSAPTTSATPAVGSVHVEWEAVPRATKYRYRVRHADGPWAKIVQVVGTRTFTLTELDPVPHTIAVGSRVNSRWQNVWTEVTVTPLGDGPVDPDPDPDPGPTGFADYLDETGLRIDTASGLGHTFGKPCVEDLDGDGLLDIVWSNHYDGPWDVYMGLGNGTFSESLSTDWSEGDLLSDRSPTDPTLPHKDNHGCAVADFDGDGRLDLFEAIGACIGTCTKPEGMWIQQEDGSFENRGADLIAPSPTADRSRFPVAFDADADGHSDVFVSAVNTGSAASTNRLLLNDGSGRLVETSAGVDRGQRQVNCTVVADIDQDGDQDLLVCRQFALHIFRNDGARRFKRLSLGVSKSPVPRAVDVADVNGDGRLDLLLLSDRKLQIRLSIGTRFPNVSYELNVNAGRDVATPDLDGDGRPDIFVVQSDSDLDPADPGSDFVLMNNGDLDFERVQVPQSATGRGDSAAVLPNFWASGRDAVLVSNGWFGTVGDRQVIAAAGLEQPTIASTSATIEVRSEPIGAVVTVDDAAVEIPVPVLVGSSHIIEAPATMTVGGLVWRFDAWTDGGHRRHDLIAGPGASTLVASYECPLPPGDPSCSAG